MGFYRCKGLAVLISSAIATVGHIVLYTNPSIAQITPDATLPNNSQVDSVNKTLNITEGTSAGGNLFHSFKEFSVPTGWEAVFNNGADVQNILTRVTGKSISNIDGLIKANGSANLFLINPNGIVFGENTRLDIGGSFIGTSAESMKFSDGSEFSAVNLQESPLLTVNVPLGLQYGTNPGSIQVRGNGQGRRSFDSAIIDTQDALRVQPDKTLALVGGDIKLEGATLKTAGGRIELGSVGENSLVNLVPIEKGFSFDYSGVENFGDIQLSQQANVDASGEAAGDIQVQGKRLSLTDASKIETSTLGKKQGGDLVVNATESVETLKRSKLDVFVYPKATGDGGDLTIKTGQLLVQDGSQVNNITFGKGNSGNLNITASESIQLIGHPTDGKALSGLLVQTKLGASGDTGDLNVQTRRLLVRDGAQLAVATFGSGNGGNLNVTATESIEATGMNADGNFGSGLFAQANPDSTGNAGNLNIQTRQLLLKNGAVVSVNTYGPGNSGKLNVKASERVEVIGGSTGVQFSSGLFAGAQPPASGNGGDLNIQTPQLLLRDKAILGTSTFGAGKGGNLAINTEDLAIRDGAIIRASTVGAGNAGNVQINTKKFAISDGSTVRADTFGSGDGGNLNITATESIEVIGTSADGEIASNLSTGGGLNSSTGNGGDITIETPKLLILDGGQIDVATFGAGNGGNLQVNADKVQIKGRYPDGLFPAGLFTNADLGATGNAGNIKVNASEFRIQTRGLVFSGTRAGTQSPSNGGDIEIDAEQLLLQNGGQIGAGTRGLGRGGDVIIKTNTLKLIGRDPSNIPSSISASSVPNIGGNAGNLLVNTRELFVQDGASISVNSRGTGTAGNLTINARSINLDNQGLLAANTRSATINSDKEQATININSRDLILRRQSNIVTTASGENGIGGNININTDILAGFENSDIRADSINFRGGNVRINTKGFFGIQFRDIASLLTSDITATGANNELNGNVEITTPDLDSTNSLIELPVNLVDAANQISNACTPGGSQFQNEFVITGRGGLPMSPTEPLQESNTISAWVRLKPQSSNSASTTIKSPSTEVSDSNNNNNKVKQRTQIIEATGWIVDKHGNIEFVAQANQINPQSRSLTAANCSVSK